MALQTRADRRIGRPDGPWFGGRLRHFASRALDPARGGASAADAGPDRDRRTLGSSFASAGLLQLVGNLRPGYAAVLQLPFGHGSELASGPGPLAPSLYEVHQRPPKPHEPHRLWRTGPAGGRDVVQSAQLAALTGACGNGPSALSVRTESQYSRISLILPSSNWNTRQ